MCAQAYAFAQHMDKIREITDQTYNSGTYVSLQVQFKEQNFPGQLMPAAA